MKLPKWLFWWDSFVKELLWEPFWWIFIITIVLIVPFFRVWWWLIIPFILMEQAVILYRWWIAWDFTYAKTKWVILELVPPKEILTPMKAMEDVFTMLWPIYDEADWKNIWIEGELDNAPYWFSFEIASIEGAVHFYARFMAAHRSLLESILYTHFPEIEIHEVADYTKNVPQDIPNADWDMYAEDMKCARDFAYPIRTYEKFFEPQGERISAEEKRIDPMISMLEAMSKLGPGEQYWVQFITIPIGDSDDDWKSRAKKLIEKLSRRPVKKETSFMEDVMAMLQKVIIGPDKEGSGEKASYKWMTKEKTDEGDNELLLTPGEKEVLLAIEDKIKKPVFRLQMRGVYMAKRENWRGSHQTILRSYAAHFKTEHLNSMFHNSVTRTKVKYFMIKRRLFLKKRRMFRSAIERFPSRFPKMQEQLIILNTEEMASIFHFPIKITGLVAPSVVRIESKKGGPPPNLPV